MSKTPTKLGRIRKTPHSKEKVVHLDRLASFEERTRTESPGPGTSSQKKPLCIIVEGNIGCRKTTFTKRFMADPRVCTLLEPLNEYRNIAGVNLLELMYRDPDRFCYQFQNHVQQVMCDRHLQVTSLPVKNSALLIEALGLIVDLIVYLRVSPETSSARISSRSREEEFGVSFELPRTLHEVHEEWLVIGKFSSLPASLPYPVMIIDAETSADQVYNDLSIFTA
ncbi:deoxynucleoside kinase-like [Diprion similis]|uniref:deoxynucleoside kinase-like n=1 Tax=Diprion similis TaxID=362088 RepID=UPI001EF7B643|nr:deoxynucleoside kinase-like [Diprion similis]